MSRLSKILSHRWINEQDQSFLWDVMVRRNGAPSSLDFHQAPSEDAEYELQRDWNAAYDKASRDIHSVRVLSERRSWRDDYGDVRIATVTIKAPDELTARFWAGHFYGESHCTHSYDCCGHFYNSAPRIRRTKRREYVITSVAYQNV